MSSSLLKLERSLVFIKPDHIIYADEILSDLDNYGSRIETARVDSIPREVIELHDINHMGKSFFEYMIGSYIGKSITLAVYQGPNIIHDLMQIIGETDPSKSRVHTIRAKYSDDSMEKAIQYKRPLRNVIHRSDSLKEALREIGVWQKFLNQ